MKIGAKTPSKEPTFYTGRTTVGENGSTENPSLETLEVKSRQNPLKNGGRTKQLTPGDAKRTWKGGKGKRSGGVNESTNTCNRLLLSVGRYQAPWGGTHQPDNKPPKPKITVSTRARRDRQFGNI